MKVRGPEQRIAAAPAACFTTVLSSLLSAAGHTPESVRRRNPEIVVTATLVQA
jgi:organic hydroperoxide reductase OsmC/OhrA